MTQFERVKDFVMPDIVSRRQLPGDIICPRGLSDDDLSLRGQNLIYTLWEHPAGRALALERDVVFAGGQRYCSDDDLLSWQLACWRTPELRSFFDALGFRVHE